jgi:uncharacterized beta-barrel protein YwiB (DUF1934 family)
LYITKYNKNNSYFIDYNETYTDDELAGFLELEREEFDRILIRHGAIVEDGTHYFKNKNDAKYAIEELTPYLMMVILTE